MLEGTVSFQPNDGESFIITHRQMISASDGVAGEMTNFLIDNEMAIWSEETQDKLRAIFAESGQEPEQKRRNSIPAENKIQESQ